MKVKLVLLSLIIFTIDAHSDAPIADEFWQRNNNVTIDKIYVYWDESVTRLLLDNGEVCYINKADKDIYSLALSMQAQKAKGSLICQIANSFNFEGKDAKRVHRILID
jgi:hypothetical protein